MPVNSISPFSHNVFYTIKDRNYHLCYIYFVVCKSFEFGQGHFFGNGLKQLYGFYRKLASEVQLRPTFTFFSQIIKYLSLTLIFNLQFAIMGFFVQSVDQDQPARRCSLILIYTLRCSINDFFHPKPMRS